jgi:RNA-directed DNA polymerase
MKIYAYIKKGDFRAAKILQKRLINSKYAKLLAVRRITQDNRGKKTAGVDGVKMLPPTERSKLVNRLKLDGSASRIKRIHVPKKDGTSRPLGIPTIEDRCKQMLIKMALEPE